MERVHSNFVRFYCCHECPVKYQKSYRLTKHLIDTHHLQLPNGHRRFRYKKDEDGFYRLQVVRYESLDEEASKPPKEDVVLNDKNYKLELTQSLPSAKLEVEFISCFFFLTCSCCFDLLITCVPLFVTDI